TVGEADGLAHARWYEFDTTPRAPALRQWGDVTPGQSGANTYYPAVEIAPDGSVGMTFMESSPGEPMSMYVTGRAAADAPNALQPPVLVQPGAGRYTETFGLPYRAGDFGGIGVDPLTGVFWAAHEFANTAAANNWGTWVTAFTVSPGAP